MKHTIQLLQAHGSVSISQVALFCAWADRRVKISGTLIVQGPDAASTVGKRCACCRRLSLSRGLHHWRP